MENPEPEYSGRGRRPKALGPRTHKRCGKCSQIKTVEEFALRRSGTTAYAAYCKPCSSMTSVAWARKNIDRHNSNVRRWRTENPEKIKASRANTPIEKRRQYDQDHYAKNPEKRRKKSRDYHAANRDLVAQKYREWRLANPGKNAAKSMAYEARKRQAMPHWVDKVALADIYDQCAAMNLNSAEKFQVDHIMPLASPIMCGLHVPYNLQIIPASENQRKGNRVTL